MATVGSVGDFHFRYLETTLEVTKVKVIADSDSLLPS